MSYHYTTTSTAARQSTTNAQGQTAPPGYHYMPDGSLMADSDMLAPTTNSHSPKVIKARYLV